ncbi:MAG TPA: hypothetical protein P5539_05455 [Mesotoga sp.]|nr:hypothetical protein [Mesotoga sp.]
MSDFTITKNPRNNGDFIVKTTTKTTYPKNTTRATTTKAPTPVVKPKFILLNPIQPSFFGLADDQIHEMCEDLSGLGYGVMLVEAQFEMMFYLWSNSKSSLEEICTEYNLKGVVVESTAVYDQVEMPELV